MCSCDFCKLYSEVRRAQKGKSRKHMRQMIEKLSSLYWHTSSDLNYSEAILDGSWPSAVEQLERALVKAKTIHAEREAVEAAPHNSTLGD